MKALKPRAPSEAFEAKRLVQYLEAKGWKFSHVPNEGAGRRRGAKNKALGTRKGVPDYVVITPKGVVWVELKRQRGGRVSPEQREWVEALTAAGTPARICLGFSQAKEFLETCS